MQFWYEASKFGHKGLNLKIYTSNPIDKQAELAFF